MKQEEKKIISNLFSKLKKTETDFPNRNKEAEEYIKDFLNKQPNSFYYIIQTILVQESVIKNLTKKLNETKRKIKKNDIPNFIPNFNENLKNHSQPESSSTFSKNTNEIPQNYRNPNSLSFYSENSYKEKNNSFLKNALQTATGVAGGIVLGNMVSSLFQHNNSTQVDHNMEHNDTIINESINEFNTIENDPKNDMLSSSKEQHHFSQNPSSSLQEETEQQSYLNNYEPAPHDPYFSDENDFSMNDFEDYDDIDYDSDL